MEITSGLLNEQSERAQMYPISPGGLEWIPFVKRRGKNIEILALFGMKEQVSKEYQFICGKVSLLNETNI